MRRHRIMTKKNRAQAMVEFAIALPILLLLLYGILEAGRLLFIYSSIVTASRQAVRYGSTTGMGLDYTADSGPDNSTFQRYRDCYGIRRAAQRADYLNAFEDNDIRIYYDTGPGTTQTEICTGGAVNWSSYSVSNNTRLVVNIDGDFLPIVPRIVPFMRRSADNTPPNPIEGDSARTILVSVSIHVTAPPSTWVPSTPTSPAPTDTPPPPTDTPPPPTDTPPPSPTSTVTDTPAGPTATATNTGTPTETPTSTPTGTATNTGTPTSSPTTIPTDVPAGQCFALTSPGTFIKSGNTMRITVSNQNAFPISIDNVFVQWNGSSGHDGQGSGGSGDNTLDLTSVTLGGTVIWTGTIDGASSVTIDPTSATLAASASNVPLVFNFHQSYDNWNNQTRERVIIFFNPVPGCIFNPVDVTR